MPTWDSSQYLKFANERTQPAVDLAARIALETPAEIVDLGCGPGNSTAVVARRWPAAKLLGLDSSAEMIAAAKEQQPEWHWEMADIATWTTENQQAFDLVFSNAALQWVPNHARVLPELLLRVKDGGALAFQVPADPNAPAHQIARTLTSSVTWKPFFATPVREWQVEEPSFYYDVLAERATRLEMWTTDYYHVMSSAAGIVEWYRGTGLRPFLEKLSDPIDQERFIADYLQQLEKVYLPRSNGKVLFPFSRLFVVAYR
ncbi:MAG: methyltransferase domain-containing protein [Nibricoccus sp.]